MAPVPDRQTLESLKRAELQKICKEHRIKANQKSEDLINQLLDVQATSLKPGSSAKPESQTKTRGKHKRNDSKVAAEQVRAEQQEQLKEVEDVPRDMSPTPDDVEQPPEAAGKAQARPANSKPRALTKTLISPRSRRTIQSRDKGLEEEQDDNIMSVPTQPQGETNGAGSSEATNGSSPNPVLSSLESLAAVDKHVADAIRPLHEQMEKFKAEFEQMQTLKAQSVLIESQTAEITVLKEQVKSLQTEVEGLRSEVASVPSLQLEIDRLKEALEPRATVTPPNPRTPPSPGNTIPRVFQDYQAQPPKASPMSKQDFTPTAPHPGVARILLGKRTRDSIASDMFSAEQDASTSSVHKPERKRPKISRGQSDQLSDPVEHMEESRSFDEDVPGPSTQPRRRAPAFTVFNDTEHPDDDMDAPPTNHLPEFFSQSSPLQPAPDLPATNVPSENQQPFRFSFLPPAAAPAASLFQNSLTYLDSPTTPTPGGPHTTPATHQSQSKRNDVFQAFGLPPPGRPGRFAGRSLGSGSDDPPTLGRSGRATSGREIANDNSPMKRTMYGTELDSDTRFGDFGVEGVGGSSSFWSGN